MFLSAFRKDQRQFRSHPLSFAKSDSFRVLIVATPGLGDAFLASSLALSISNAYPCAEIHMLVRSGREALVKEIPVLSRVISFDYRSTLRSYLKMVSTIFRKYDLAVSTADSDRATLVCLYAAPHRVGVVPPLRLKDCWKRLIHRGYVESNLLQHILLRNNALGRALGVESPVQLPLPSSSSQIRDELPSKTFVVIHPCASSQHKAWSPGNWHSLITMILSEDYQVLLTGGPGNTEQEYVQSLASTFPEGVFNLCGKLSFSELVHTLKQSTGYIGVDTCIAHLAAAANIPTVVVVGPSNLSRWAPWPYGYDKQTPPFHNSSGVQSMGNVHVIKGQCPCPGVRSRKCSSPDAEGTSLCMTAVSTEEVILVARNAGILPGQPSSSSRIGT